MCKWCHPENKPRQATYEVGGTKFSITIEGNEIIIYRYSPHLNNRADMALEFPINYCPMCGEMILEDEDEEEESTQSMDIFIS